MAKLQWSTGIVGVVMLACGALGLLNQEGFFVPIGMMVAGGGATALAVFFFGE